MPISELLHEDEPRKRPIFVSLDAQFLWDTAEELMFGERTPELLRLQSIAHRLERMDEQVRNLSSSSMYQAGIMEGKRRMLDRSNLPVQEVELGPDLAKAVRDSKVPIKKIKIGVSGLAEVTDAPKPVKPSVLAAAGIKLNLTGLK